MEKSKKVKCELKRIRLQEYMIDSKTEFAKKLEVPVQTYIKWENEINTPNLLMALNIAEKLNRTVNEIWHL